MRSHKPHKPRRLFSRAIIMTAALALAFTSVESALNYYLVQHAQVVQAELNDPSLAITKYGMAAPPLGVEMSPESQHQQYGAVGEEVRAQGPGGPAADMPTNYADWKPDETTEDIAQRTPNSKTYKNNNGSSTTTYYNRDIFYQEDGKSKQLGSRITADREGADGENGILGVIGAGLGLTQPKGYRADSGPVKAKFKELNANTGVSITIDNQQVAMQPIGSNTGIVPTLESHGDMDAVVYTNVWEGVDLAYEYHGDVVKELVILHKKPTTNSFSFDFKGGITLRHSTTNPGTVEGVKGNKIVFVLPELTVIAKDLGPVGDSGAAYRIDGNTVTITLNQNWLDGLNSQNYPVVIDPTVGISNASNDYVDYKSDGAVCASSSCWLYAGNLNNNGIKYWRTVLHIPLGVPAGQTVSYANLHLEKQMTGPAWYGDNTAQTYYVQWASCLGYNCIGTSSPAMPITVSTSGNANIAPLVSWMQQNGIGDGGWLIIHGDGAAFKAFNAYATHVDITYNSAPSATKVYPATNNPTINTITPKLEITATDPNNDPLTYAFHVYNLNGGFIAGSGWIDTPTWVVPDGLLQDGNTYQWSCAVWDGTTQVDAGVSNFNIDLRTGKDKSQTYDTAGPVMVNMADGNTYTTATSHSIGALGGNIGIGLDYNTPSKSKKGLTGSYYNNGTQNPVLVRTDPNIDFEWSTASPMPGVVGTDNFSVTWSGYFVAPVTGSYKFGGSNDDSFSFGIDTNNDSVFEQQFNLSCCSSAKNWAAQSVSLTAGQVYPITATLNEANYGARARLWVRMPDTTERIVPQDWLRTPAMPVTQNQGMIGKYYKDNGSHDFTTNPYPFLVQRSNNVNFNWGTSSPMPYDPWSEFSNSFMARYTGYLVVPTTGNYKFGSTADDGQRIFVNGSQVASDWGPHGPTTVWSNYISLTAGQIVPVTLEYFEVNSGAQVNLQWDGPAGVGLIPTQYMIADYNVLPDGWSLSLDGNGNLPYERLNTLLNGNVDLLDGDGTNHRYVFNAATGIYTPPVNEDGVLTRNQDGSYRLNDVDGRVYEFASDGTLTSVTAPTDDRKPAALKYDYQTVAGVPRLYKITDAVDSNRYGQLYYGGDAQCVTPSGFVAAPAGNLCAFKTYDNQVTNFYYKDAGANTPKRLSRIELPGGALTDFEVDSDGRITAVRDTLANDAIATGQRANDATVKTEIAYDVLGRAKSVKLPAATTGASRMEHTFEYSMGVNGNGSAKRHITGATEPNGYQQYMEYDVLQRTTKVCDIAALCTTTEWDANKDLVLSSTDATGLKSTIIYDDDDRPVHSYGPAPTAWYGSDRLPLSAYVSQVAHNEVAYDQNIVGPEVTYYNYKSANKILFGASKLRTTGVNTASPGTMAKNWGSTPPITIDTGAGANGWGLRATGKLRVTTSGDYNFNLWHDDGARLSIGNTNVINDWNDGTYRNSTGLAHLDSGVVYDFVLEYYDTNQSAAQLDLRMAIGTPVSTDNVFGSKLVPGYNLQTSQTRYDSTLGNVTATANYGSTPEFGLAQSTTLDPTGLNYTNTAAYETPGSGFLRQTSKTLPGGGTTSYNYYTDQQTKDNPCTTGTTEAFRQAGRAKGKTEVDPDGAGSQTPRTTETIYDDAGRPVAGRYNSDGWTCYTYDSRSRLVTTTIPALGQYQPGRTVTNSYAVSGNPFVVSTTDANGTIYTTIDLLGRTVSYTDALGTTTTSTYDNLGRLTSRSGPLGIEEFVYDTYNRLTDQKLDSIVYAHVNYDSYSRVDNVTYPDAGQQKVVYGRDALNRLNGLTYTISGGSAGSNLIQNPSLETASGAVPANWVSSAWGTNTPAFTYEATGHTGSKSVKTQLTAYTDGDAKWYFNPVDVTGNTNYTFSDWYKSSAWSEYVVQFTNQDTSVSYQWLGGKAASASWAQSTYSFTTPATAVKATVFHLLAEVGWVQIDDADLHLTSTPNTISDTVTRSASGIVVSGTENGVSKSYTYDKASRLTSATIGSNTFTYDFSTPTSGQCGQASANLNANKNSNRTKLTVNGTTTTYCYDYADRLIASSDPLVNAPEYDAHGNITKLGSGSSPVRPAYDSSDRNRGIEQYDSSGNGQAMYYERDAQNRIMSRYKNTITNWDWVDAGSNFYAFTGAGDGPSFVRDASWAITEKYLSLPGGVLLTLRPNKPVQANKKMYSLRNVHGDAFALTNASGTLVSTHLTGPFGEPITGQTNPTNTVLGTTFGYTGSFQKLTETTFPIALTQMGARLYIPILGRFAQVDPVEGGALNSYVYAMDPVNQSDLSGRCVPGVFCAGNADPAMGSIQGTVGTAAVPTQAVASAAINTGANKSARVVAPVKQVSAKSSSPVTSTYTFNVLDKVALPPSLSRGTEVFGPRPSGTGGRTKPFTMEDLGHGLGSMQDYAAMGAAGGAGVGCTAGMVMFGPGGCALLVGPVTIVGGVIGGGVGFFKGLFNTGDADAFDGAGEAINPWW